MAKDYNNFFDDLTDELRDIYDDVRDRFYDEHDEMDEERPKFCGECSAFDRCPDPAHACVGKCNVSGDWKLESSDCDVYEE